MAKQQVDEITNSAVVAQAAATAAASQAASAAAVVGADIKYIQRDIAEIKDIIRNMSSEFVTKTEFDPIKRVVYGMVTLILTTFLIGALALVLNK